MRERIFGVLQRVGRAFMLPIAILPVAGLLLGIGSSFTNETWLQTNNLLSAMGPGTLLYTILSVMAACGDIVFTNLSIIFAVGVAIGMAKKEKEVAALSGAIAFFVMHSAIGAMLKITGAAANMLPGAVAAVVGIESLQMGVFGGIIVGLGVAALHNRFYKIELPQVLAFFGGTRFVPIISAAVDVTCCAAAGPRTLTIEIFLSSSSREKRLYSLSASPFSIGGCSKRKPRWHASQNSG